MKPKKYTFKSGKFKCTIFKDLMWKYKAKDFFVNTDPKELAQSLEKYDINPENIPSPFIAILLEDEDRKILIDTGCGYLDEPLVFRENEFLVRGKLTQLLAEEGVHKEEITDVILTHFHLDHIGGVYSDSDVLKYPNAKFFVRQEEWDFWHSSKSDSQPPLFRYYIRKNITPLKHENLNFIRSDFEEIIPGIISVNAEGHTPGQIALIINHGQRENQFLYLSDAFLHPLHIERIDWQTNYDFDNEKAKETRLKLLDMAYTEDMLINGFHFDFPGIGRVDKLNNKWIWHYQQS